MNNIYFVSKNQINVQDEFGSRHYKNIIQGVHEDCTADVNSFDAIDEEGINNMKEVLSTSVLPKNMKPENPEPNTLYYYVFSFKHKGYFVYAPSGNGVEMFDTIEGCKRFDDKTLKEVEEYIDKNL